MFVCFAPKENPRIAIAVAVENAGFGATWGGPIARILMEKYLNDTLQAKSVEDVERIANTNLMPDYYKRLQYKTDSLRARDWFKKTNDSTYILKYMSYKEIKIPVKKEKPVQPQSNQQILAILPDNKYSTKQGQEPIPA